MEAAIRGSNASCLGSEPIVVTSASSDTVGMSFKDVLWQSLGGGAMSGLGDGDGDEVSLWCVLQRKVCLKKAATFPHFETTMVSWSKGLAFHFVRTAVGDGFKQKERFKTRKKSWGNILCIIPRAPGRKAITK
jgi:hypothetical protein